MWFVPERSDAPERMDRTDNRAEDLVPALRDIRHVNRFLGGTRVVLDALDELLRDRTGQGTLDVLDVGTGSADLAVAMVRRGLRHGRRVRVFAVDRDPVVADVAARFATDWPAVRVLRADAFRLPFPPQSVDVVTASMFLHHFPHPQVVELLRRFRGVARRAVLVNDLRRHRLAWASIALLAHATRRAAMFTHDGPLSVLRGFTDAELLAAGREAGAESPVVRRRWPYRLLMILSGTGST